MTPSFLFPTDRHVDGSGIDYKYPGIHTLVTAERLTKQDMAFFASSVCEDEPGHSTKSDSSRDDGSVQPSDVDEDDTNARLSWSSDNDTDGVTIPTQEIGQVLTQVSAHPGALITIRMG